MQTPSWPENFAYAVAMNAAISSCRACTKPILPSARFIAPKTPLMPSPG